MHNEVVSNRLCPLGLAIVDPSFPKTKSGRLHQNPFSGKHSESCWHPPTPPWFTYSADSRTATVKILQDLFAPKVGVGMTMAAFGSMTEKQGRRNRFLVGGAELIVVI